MMSVPDAELFTKNYKMMYPSGNGFAGGGWLRKYETGGPKNTNSQRSQEGGYTT